MLIGYRPIFLSVQVYFAMKNKLSGHIKSFSILKVTMVFSNVIFSALYLKNSPLYSRLKFKNMTECLKIVYFTENIS